MGFDAKEALVVRQEGANRWVLEQPLRYRGGVDTFVVPAGYLTDFASVPRFLWWLVPRYGQYTKASVVHDYLCDRAAAGTFERLDADGIFRRMMRELGVPFLQRWIMWAGVRWGGGVRGILNGGIWQVCTVILVTAVALPFVVPSGLVVLATLSCFYLAEWLLYLPVSIANRRRATLPRFTRRL